MESGTSPFPRPLPALMTWTKTRTVPPVTTVPASGLPPGRRAASECRATSLSMRVTSSADGVRVSQRLKEARGPARSSARSLSSEPSVSSASSSSYSPASGTSPGPQETAVARLQEKSIRVRRTVRPPETRSVQGPLLGCRPPRRRVAYLDVQRLQVESATLGGGSCRHARPADGRQRIPAALPRCAFLGCCVAASHGGLAAPGPGGEAGPPR